MEGISNEGVFEDGFRSDVLPGYLGDDHTGSKVMDDIKDVGTLVKAFADSRTKTGQLDTAMKTALVKPADDASEDDKSVFRGKLAEMNGVPKTAAEYTFFKADKLPEGMEHNQAMEDSFRALFHKHGVPAAAVTELSEVFSNMQVENFNALIAGDTKIREEKATAELATENAKIELLKKGDAQNNRVPWTGDAASVKPRLAFGALKAFNKGDPEFIKKLNDSKIYDTPADFAAWKKLGVSAADLERWSDIGEALGVSVSATHTGGDGSGGRVIDDIYAGKME